MPKLTMLGMYEYDPTLFEDLTFPEGIEKDLAVNEILMRCGEFAILYPNLEFLKYQIAKWGQKHYRTFEKWVYALSQEYEPLFNYDRTEQESNTRSIMGTNQQSAIDTGSNNESIAEQEAGTGSNTGKVAAYDSSSLEDKNKQDTQTATSKNTSRAVTTGATSNIMGSDTENETYNHSSRVFGNIGVTTSSKMLEEYLDVQRWNIYENIAEIFVGEFCIMIY